MSEATRKRNLERPKEHFANLIAAAKEVNEKSKKPVLQLDLEGNIVKEWESLSSAAKAIGKST